MHGSFCRTIAAALAAALIASWSGAAAGETSTRRSLDELIARHALANGVPVELVHRIVRRESNYNPRARGRGGTMGLMQIKHGTARRLGYKGPPSGLLDPDINLTYGVRYLAEAYRRSGGDHGGSFALFKRGY